MLAELFTLQNLITLIILTVLETVLGFDNLLYISIEAKRVGTKKEAFVRRYGIFIAIALRIVLLFVVLKLIDLFQSPLFSFDWVLSGFSIIKGEVSGHALIVLVGGLFLLNTATKEIWHMLSVDNLGEEETPNGTRTVASAFFWIITMNIVFSFDTVLSAIALTKNFPVMAIAIIISGLLMVLMADVVAAFLKRNRMYEVLGLFVLLLVGVMLMSEGGHIAHLAFFGFEVEPMAKSTFYFVLFALVLVEILQSRYQKKLHKEAASKITDVK